MAVAKRLTVVTALALALAGLVLAPVPGPSASAATTSSPTTLQNVADPAVPNPTPVYRFYKLTDGSHFFTGSENEKAAVLRSPNIYRYEGVAFYSYPTQVPGSTAVYRFYNFKQGVHFYTSNEQEYRTVLNTASSTFRFEGIAYYSLPAQSATATSTPVYRFYKFRQGVHFYTSNQAEATYLNNTASATYRFEGVSYSLPTQLTFSGSGSAITESFVLPSTLAVFRSTYSGADSNFTVYLTETSTQTDVALLAAETGTQSDTSYPVGVDESRYVLDVASAGNWTITIDQPKSSAGSLRSFEGTGTAATQLFSIPKGTKTVSYTLGTASSFTAFIYDGQGNFIDYIAEDAPTGSDTVITFPVSGNYIIGVEADGGWVVSIG